MQAFEAREHDVTIERVAVRGPCMVYDLVGYALWRVSR
jgi:hypothetical protein